MRPSPAASATPTSPVTATPAADESPEVIHGVEVVPLQVGDEVELPDGVALIVETGCYACDGPASALLRVYRDASGELRTDALFAVGKMGLPTRLVVSSKEGTYALEPYIHSFALNSDASEMVVSVCSRGDCAWIDAASPDAQTTLFRSVDGGVTWAEFGTLDGWSHVVTIAKDGIVLWRHDRLEWAGHNSAEPELILTAIGAYQLEEVLKASARLAERAVPHSVVYMLEPGRFRAPRSKGEQAHAAPADVKNQLYPDSAVARIFVTHTRPETMLGVLQPLSTGSRTAALGFIVQGGTLTTPGLLFVNRCTWSHILEKAARLLRISRDELLTVEEQVALDGKASPEGVIIEV